MATLLAITRFLNKPLNIRNIPDNSKNGMQARGTKEVKKIGFAVDACMEVFNKAKEQDCDLIIVHHGILWKKSNVPKAQLEKRISFLKKHGISLYAAHLPLDLHPEYGNNIRLARLLGLKGLKGFGDYHKVMIGYQGRLEKSMKAPELVKILNRKLKTKCFLFDFNKRKIKTIGIVSGGGLMAVPEAIDKKIDCFLTGDRSHMAYHYAKEAGLSMISAGHYATETVGVKALMPVLRAKFGVQTVFIDAPSGL